ncbi:DUF3085 domain-containing protein [Acidovorax sp. NCPPB 4044]|uniref:DUF3085 domain-containing protein n=1 Tax=Acidovorax sp. NCPPB 4044 TaxID=2940490 RepID=UPI002304517D|nr:DUF3085 domain-containing protein [Acidovorax sp. NCPPB 4044]MDA8520431.1 DUF3085 domain-containing protein [Acidovorax sp. NCPPB 4044]
MSLRFRGADLRPVLTEALAQRCKLVLVKDQGVYWLAEHGERCADGRQKLLAYAIGCHPDVDDFDTWWNLAHGELGGDDFAEFFDPGHAVFKQVLHGEFDLWLSATDQLLSVRVVPSTDSHG